MRARPPQSATSRHYAEPIQANSGDYDELEGDYDLAGRDSKREDSSDLAPEHPTRITPRNRSSTGSSRSDLIPGRMSLGTAPRTSTGSGDHLARFETGDY